MGGGYSGLDRRQTSALVLFVAKAAASTPVPEPSVAEPEKIAECLAGGDVAAAVTALKANWESGMHRILSAVSRQSRPGRPRVRRLEV